jgi:DNA modification methylase
MDINQIICGDNVAELKKFDDESVDLTVTSPPYDNLRNYKRTVEGRKIEYNGYSFPFEELAAELYRVTKPGGVVVWVVGDATEKGSETGSSFRQALHFMDCGFNLHDTMIYEKNSISFPSKTRYYQIFEYMFVFSKGKPKTINLIRDKKNKWAGVKYWGDISARDKDGKLVTNENKRDYKVPEYGVRNNIWRYNTGKGFSSKDKEAYEHPAIFPEKLAEDHILSWSEPGDIVLDPFIGSGTTAKMAILNDRKYIGIDVVKDYCDIAKRRLEKLEW